jgi:hypothetical protein
MRLFTKLRTAAPVAAITALALTTTTALGGSGVGGVFNLGQTNTVNGTSTLTGTTGGPQLKVANSSSAYNGITATSGNGAGVAVYGAHSGTTGTGAAVRGQSASAAAPGVLGVNTGGGPGLQAIVNAGKPPLSVNSSAMVPNLNADKVDGLDAGAFWKLGGNAGTTSGTNFLGTTDAKSLVFKTNGSERMRLDSAGNLGIGTLSPANKLQVEGNAGVTATSLESQGFEAASFPPPGWTTGSTPTGFPWVRSTTTFFAGTASAASGTIMDNQSTYLDRDLTFPKDGVLRFHWKVSSEATFDFLFFCLDNDSCTSGSGFTKRISGNVDWTEVRIPVTAGAHSFRWVYAKDFTVSAGSDKGWLDDVQFEVGGHLTAANGLKSNGTLSVADTADFGSDVGIGTATPSQLLHLKVTPGHGEGMQIESGIAGHSPAVYLNHTGTGGHNFRIASFGDNTNPGSFRIRDDSGGGDRLTIDAGGNVGIATASPTRRLDINGVLGVFDSSNRSHNGGVGTEVNASLINFGMNEGSPNRFGGTYTQADQGGLLRVDTRSNVDLFQFLGRPAGTAGDATQLVGITSAGKVGIGVSSPSNILTVQQNSTTDPIADAWTTYSSRRWKTAIHPIGSALGLLEQLRGVRFTWKKSGKRDLGLIAEEVDRVLPGIVAHDKRGYAQGLDYSRLVPVLIQGAKEQQAQIRTLRRQNASLSKRMTRLERLVERRNR